MVCIVDDADELVFVRHRWWTYISINTMQEKMTFFSSTPLSDKSSQIIPPFFTFSCIYMKWDGGFNTWNTANLFRFFFPLHSLHISWSSFFFSSSFSVVLCSSFKGSRVSFIHDRNIFLMLTPWQVDRNGSKIFSKFIYSTEI